MKRIWFIVLGDFISFLLAFTILILWRFNDSTYLWAISTHTIPFLILYFIWVMIFYIFGLYDLVNIKPTIPYLKRWVWAVVVSFIVGLLLFYFVPIFGISPKINLLIQVGLFGLFSFILRRIIYSLFAKTFTRNVVLIGNSTCLNEIKNNSENNPQMGLNVKLQIKDISELNINQLKDQNILIIIDQKGKIKENILIELAEKNIEVIDTTQSYEKYLFKIPVDYVNSTFISENIKGKNDLDYIAISFLLDKFFAIFTLLLTSPVLLIAIVAKLIEDGRPVFIKQKRVGLNGQIFNLYKMRSMIVLSPDGSAETNTPVWSTGKDDPRITKVGRIIRKLHIDEIPQMINILKGDISLVGPRPERPEFVEQLESNIPHYKLRHIIRPGFTGWAQIKYHYAKTEDESKEKFEYDLYYIKNRNIFIDLGIIIRTIQIIFTH